MASSAEADAASAALRAVPRPTPETLGYQHVAADLEALARRLAWFDLPGSGDLQRRITTAGEQARVLAADSMRPYSA